MIASVRQYKLAAILLIVAMGLLLRVRGLSAQGLNEDEVNKAEAAEAYRHGDFSLNREHPMLLKLLVSVSQAGTGLWNAQVNSCCQIADEDCLGQNGVPTTRFPISTEAEESAESDTPGAETSPLFVNHAQKG